MRKILVIALTIASFVELSESAMAVDLPTRRAGLWEVTISMEGGKDTAGIAQKPQTMKQCIDKESDAKMQQTGTEMVDKMGGKCTKNTLQKTANGFEGVADCQFAGTHMISKSVFTGDFETAYSGTVDATYNPPLMGQSSAKTSISGKWLGECEAGMVAGDMVMSNGMKLNMNDLSKMGAGAAMRKGSAKPEDLQKLNDILEKSKSNMKGLNAEQIQEMMRQQH